MTRDYVLDQGFAEERKRLAGMESLWDPGSQALLEDLGITSGWRCLEVGAGAGSMVRWMADRGAHVTAIDIDTRFIDSLASDSIEVRRVDLARLIDSTSPGFDFFRLTFESLRGAVVAAGLLSVEEAEAAAGGFDGGGRLLTPMMMAGIGRRS
jgi:SAM-dependent methyltransferase